MEKGVPTSHPRTNNINPHPLLHSTQMQAPHNPHNPMFRRGIRHQPRTFLPPRNTTNQYQIPSFPPYILPQKVQPNPRRY